jgi:ferrochelatase
VSGRHEADGAPSTMAGVGPIEPAVQAVLLSCHGTVDHLDELPAFLANIRRGRPAPPEMVAEVRHRYEKIGGSPLMAQSRANAADLSARLGVPVAVAGRLWGPYPGEVLADLASRGVRRVVSLPLAPQSVDIYHAAVRDAAAKLEGLELAFVPTWGEEPALLDAFSATIEQALPKLGEGPASEQVIVLSAHSLPKRVLAMGDPYEGQFRAMAELVAKRFRARGHVVEIAFQSQGMTGDEWLGPDLETTFRDLVGRGLDRVLVAPIGFLAEHVETLYDLDVDAPTIAERAGVRTYARAAAVASQPKLVDALEAVARRALASFG